jgi:AAA15 family ATPase/GTPase
MKKRKKILIYALIIIILGLGAFYTFTYYVTFSEGYRAGELIKISRKGVIFKTWEGQISQGVSEAQLFSFSIQDKEKDIINKMKELQGKNVKLAYKERFRTFPWLGDTRYFITDIEESK